MNGYRFYEDYSDKRKGISTGNVVAVIPENRWIIEHADGSVDEIIHAISAVFYRPNSDVCGTSTTQAYLSEYCKRISESKAREIHPALFQYLDQVD